jgi:hypothetical protein
LDAESGGFFSAWNILVNYLLSNRLAFNIQYYIIFSSLPIYHFYAPSCVQFVLRCMYFTIKYLLHTSTCFFFLLIAIAYISFPSHYRLQSTSILHDKVSIRLDRSGKDQIAQKVKFYSTEKLLLNNNSNDEMKVLCEHIKMPQFITYENFKWKHNAHARELTYYLITSCCQTKGNHGEIIITFRSQFTSRHLYSFISLTHSLTHSLRCLVNELSKWFKIFMCVRSAKNSRYV